MDCDELFVVGKEYVKDGTLQLGQKMWLDQILRNMEQNMIKQTCLLLHFEIRQESNPQKETNHYLIVKRCTGVFQWKN